jgi:hypothetical protein
VRDDQPRGLGRILELAVADRGERQIAERAASFPALETRLRDDTFRLGFRVQAVERLQPVDAGKTVAALAAAFGVEEMVGERPRVLVGEAERAQPTERILGQDRTGSGLTIVPRSSASTASAMRSSSSAVADSGAVTISGAPASPHSRNSGSS